MAKKSPYGLFLRFKVLRTAEYICITAIVTKQKSSFALSLRVLVYNVWWASKQLSSLQWYVFWTLNYDFWIIWHRSGVMLIRRMIFFVFVENNPKKSSHIQDQPSIKSKHLVNDLPCHTYKYENWEINLWWPFCTCLPFGKCYFVCHRSHRHTQLQQWRKI